MRSTFLIMLFLTPLLACQTLDPMEFDPNEPELEPAEEVDYDTLLEGVTAFEPESELRFPYLPVIEPQLSPDLENPQQFLDSVEIRNFQCGWFPPEEDDTPYFFKNAHSPKHYSPGYAYEVENKSDRIIQKLLGEIKYLNKEGDTLKSESAYFTHSSFSPVSFPDDLLSELNISKYKLISAKFFEPGDKNNASGQHIYLYYSLKDTWDEGHCEITITDFEYLSEAEEVEYWALKKEHEAYEKTFE